MAFFGIDNRKEFLENKAIIFAYHWLLEYTKENFSDKQKRQFISDTAEMKLIKEHHIE